MIKKLLPILLFLIGTGAGVGAGVFLRPEAPPEMAEDGAKEEVVEPEPEEEIEEDPKAVREYVKLSNQFVVPLVEDGDVSALVVLTLSIEVMPGAQDAVFAREPKIRDSFLQVLFDFATVGGFSGAFTDVSQLDLLRTSLKNAALRYGSDEVTDVLILEIARQDL